MRYTVIYSQCGDRARPYRVKDNERSYNVIVGQYATETQAKKRAKDLNCVANDPIFNPDMELPLI